MSANDEDVTATERVGEHLRMALAEAGYPDAVVWGVDVDGPWFCDDVPVAVWDRACEVVNR